MTSKWGDIAGQVCRVAVRAMHEVHREPSPTALPSRWVCVSPGSCTTQHPSSPGGCCTTEWPLLNDFTARTRYSLVPICTIIMQCRQLRTARVPNSTLELWRAWRRSCVRMFPALGDPVAGHLTLAVSGNLKGHLFSGARFEE